MKKVFSLLAVAAMALAANAQDLVIATNGNNPDIKVLQSGRFDPISNNIGNTSDKTIIDLGVVDFDTEYAAAGMRFAQGWGGNGNFAILSAGNDIDSAVPFTQLALAHTQSYCGYRTLAGNMGYNAQSEADLAGGRLAKEGLTFSKPEGKKHVFLTFVGGAGNIQAVYFYKNAFNAYEFAAASGDDPTNGRLLNPNERGDYQKVSLPISGATLVTSPSSDTRIDGDSWGWTQEGVVVNYGQADFTGVKQVVVFAKHWSNDKNDWLEFYIDEVSEENHIATLFVGLELRDRLYPLAKNLNKTVTGNHNLIVKWRGGSTNVGDIDLAIGGMSWIEMPDADIEAMQQVDEQPSASAKRYTMLNDVPEGAIKIDAEIKNKGQFEGTGNIGYTGNGSIIRLKNIDFENGQFNKILITHACDKSWVDYINDANFSLYLDFDETAQIDWTNKESVIAGHEPVAVVRLQGTGNWGTRMTTKGDLAPVTGVHDVYVVYNVTYSDDGANIFDYYLDYEEPTAVNEVNVTKVNNGVVYSIDGRIVRTSADSLEGLDAGLYIFNGKKYLVK